MIIIPLAMIVSFGIVVLIIPQTIKTLRQKDKVAPDIHKFNAPKIPKGGGFVLLFGITGGILLVMGLSTFQAQEMVTPGLLAGLVSLLMAGMIGILDDELDFSNRTKIVLPLIASIPLIAMNIGTTTMEIPIIGVVNLLWFYPLVIIPLMTTFIIDSTNMYAGMNGLEAGLSVVNSSAVVSYVLLLPVFTNSLVSQGQIDGGTVAAALLGASLAFFIFNRYPAKILPGDVGRLPMGAAMASALILGNMDRLAIFLYIPFMINFLLYLVYRVHVRRSGMGYKKFAKPRENGTLEVPGPYTVYWILPYLFDKMTEKTNVATLILLQAILAYGAVIILLVAHPFGKGWI